jgi:hypothetical protein
MSGTCSLEEMKLFKEKLIEGVVPDSQLNEMVAAIKKHLQTGEKKVGGGKYSTALIHTITTTIILISTGGTIHAAMHVLEKSGAINAFNAYQGISEWALYGCNSAVGIGARQIVSDNVPFLTPSCSYSAQQIEFFNKQIYLVLRAIAVTIGLRDAARGLPTYSVVYEKVENYLNTNDVPALCVLPATGGRKMKKRGGTKKAYKSRHQRRGRKMTKSKKVLKKSKKSRGRGGKK